MEEAPAVRAYRIHARDNVATLLSEAQTGDSIKVLGEGDIDTSPAAPLETTEHISPGHKVALKGIRVGEQVMKYGVSIGTATADIAQGAWVHLHNLKSNYDERSSSLEVDTGAATDTVYE